MMPDSVSDMVVVIPARMESTRLRRKPLADIGGRPMILRTVDRARLTVDAEKIFVATDHQDILEVCEADGVNCVMTSEACLTGTDRVAEFANTIAAQTYINLQGDEPTMEPDDIRRVMDAAQRHPDWIVNGWAWITSEIEYRARTIPKVVMREDGRLLYMSRAPIPGTKEDTFAFSRKQICVYAFPAHALKLFASLKRKTPHEEAEDIEILRFLELGHEVQMVELSGRSQAVDTEDDLDKIRRLFSGKIE